MVISIWPRCSPRCSMVWVRQRRFIRFPAGCRLRADRSYWTWGKAEHPPRPGSDESADAAGSTNRDSTANSASRSRSIDSSPTQLSTHHSADVMACTQIAERELATGRRRLPGECRLRHLIERLEKPVDETPKMVAVERRFVSVLRRAPAGSASHD